MKLNKTTIILGGILILAFVIRAYNLHDWLYFQADQVRNTNHAHEILEKGFSGIPLLGPKAGGTDFHLGPISYWLEAVPALLFGLNHPAVVVYSNLFFILASILLVYYFLRQGFSRNTSLQITTLYAFGYVVIQYSRFSWNPNSLLFWGLLFILGTYKVFQKNNQYKGRWLIVVALSYGIVSQLHTTALLGYPGVFGLYWLYKSIKGLKKYSLKEIIQQLFQISPHWKYWLGGVLIVLITYTPVIIFDIENNGHNAQEFIKAFGSKTSDNKTMGQKLYRELSLMGKYYSLNVLSLNKKEIPAGLNKNFLLINWLGVCLLIWAGWIVLYFRKTSKTIGKIFKKDDFLALNFIWWFVFFILFFPLAYKLDQMRFWFIAFLVPYVALAIIFEWLKTKKNGNITVGLIVAIILILNLTAVANWYVGLERQDRQNRFYRQPMTSTLQQSDWVTYEKMQEAVAYMVRKSGKRNSCFRAPSKYRASYRYIFNHNYPENSGEALRGKIVPEDLEQCNVYLIKHSQKTTKDIITDYNKDGKDIKLQQPHKFGVITVWRVSSLTELNKK